MSLSSKIDEIRLVVRKIAPEIAVFTETWLKKAIPDSVVNISGFIIFRKDRLREPMVVFVFTLCSSIFRLFKLKQYANFQTRGERTLDMILTNIPQFYDTISRQSRATKTNKLVGRYRYLRVFEEQVTKFYYVYIDNFMTNKLCANRLHEYINGRV